MRQVFSSSLLVIFFLTAGGMQSTIGGMKRSCIFRIILIVMVWMCSFNLPLFAQDEEQDLDTLETTEDVPEQEETLEALETVWAEEASIASRVTGSIKEAPSVVTVITAQQIRDMGARTLQDVLKIVPGFDALPYEISGFPSDTYFSSLSVLVLHNGARLNDYYSGSASGTEYQIFLENVERIEIIAGPGSAMYGANAFAGVINIVTKTPEQIDGIQCGDERSSFAGQRYHLLAGKQFGDWGMSLFAQYFQDDGQKFWVSADQYGQEGYIQDKQMGAMDLDLQLGYRDLSFEMRYLHRKPHTFFSDVTIQPSSDEDLRFETQTFSAHGTYQRSLFNEKGSVNLHTEYKRTLLDLELALKKPFRVYNYVPTEDMAGEISFSYTFFDRHIATIGLRLGSERLFDSRQETNYDIITETYLGSMRETSSNNPDSERTIFSAYLEDVWTLSEQVQMTLGGRFDTYTQFGSTLNPRGSFVYTPLPELSLRLMYANAFRAPTAVEAYDRNFGSEDIAPETITMYGGALSYTLFDIWQFQGFYSYGDIEDLINIVEDPATPSRYTSKNIGNGISRNLGIDVRGLHPWGYVWGNYFTVEAKMEGDADIPGIPKHFASAGINCELGSYLNLNLWSYFRGERLLESEGGQAETASYTNVNLNVRVTNLLDNLEGYFTVYNLLDADYAYPGLQGLTIPARGREVIVGVRYMM